MNKQIEFPSNKKTHLYDTKELSERLSVSERSIRNWIFTGQISNLIVKVGRLIRFDSDKVEDRIKKGNILDKQKK